MATIARRSDTTTTAVLAGQHGSLVDVRLTALTLDVHPNSVLRSLQRGRPIVVPALAGPRPKWAVNDLRAVHRLPPLTLEEMAAAQAGAA